MEKFYIRPSEIKDEYAVPGFIDTEKWLEVNSMDIASAIKLAEIHYLSDKRPYFLIKYNWENSWDITHHLRDCAWDGFQYP